MLPLTVPYAYVCGMDLCLATYSYVLHMFECMYILHNYAYLRMHVRAIIYLYICMHIYYVRMCIYLKFTMFHD